jgi:hypothetical protein
MNDIPEEVRAALIEGEDLQAFKDSPGCDVLRKVLDDAAHKAVLAMLSCSQVELPEWRGRAQAILGIMDTLNGRIFAARELAAGIRAQVEATSERERIGLEQAIERRQRSFEAPALEREGSY